MFAKLVGKKHNCQCGSSFVNTIFISVNSSAVWDDY
jgi:hypothetical protein